MILRFAEVGREGDLFFDVLTKPQCKDKRNRKLKSVLKKRLAVSGQACSVDRTNMG